MRDVSERLLPYVPRLVVDWLRDTPTVAHQRVTGSLAFCDVSGFTALTERLAVGGRAGAEEMGGILNQVFTELLVEAYDQGAALLKYGGDAVLLLFQGPDHELRACRATWSMQSAIRRVGDLKTSVGPARLKMSVGVHSGLVDFFLSSGSIRELVVAGPVASLTAQLEAQADAGEVLVSSATAERLSDACLGAPKGDGRLLAAPPGVSPFATYPLRELPDLSTALSRAVVEHVLAGFTASEHRVVVPGFLQVRGLDALLAEDGPGAVAAELDRVLGATVEACDRHGVTFIGSDIAPDGAKVIVVGGAPRAIDDAQSRVVLTLREAVSASSSLRLRAGTAAGRVFTGDYGPPYRRTYSGIGDAVNLAARVMGKAADGEVLATRALLAAARTPFLTSPLEPFLVKGKSEPVLASAVIGVSEHADEHGHPLPFTGREVEVAALRQWVDEAASGRGCCVEVIGAAGAGRSRLLSEALAPVVHPVVSVCCDAYAAATPYSVLRRLVSRALGDGQTLIALDQALHHQPQLAPWRPLLAALLGFDVEATPEVEALDERFRARHLRDAVIGLLSSLTGQPTVFVVDDFHLADTASAAVVDALGDAASERPWLVVLSRRAVSASEVTDLHGEPIWLAPLDDLALRGALLRAPDAQELSERQLDDVVTRSAGNPLYAAQLVEALLAGLDSDELPDNLEALAAAQIDALEPRSRRLLRLAAVCGTAADRRLLARVLDEDADILSTADWAALGRLVDLDGDRIRFRQSVIRDAAYAGLSFAERRGLHARIGQALAGWPSSDEDERTALLSFHFHYARLPTESLRASELAADRALARYATAEAARFYDRAVEAASWMRPRPHTEIARLSLAASRAWFAVGENARAGAALQQLPRELSPDLRAEALLRDVKIRLRTGAYTRGLRRLSQLEALLDALPPESAAALRAEVLVQRAFTRHLQGREREAIRWAQRAVDAADQVAAKAPLAQALQILDWAYVGLGRFDQPPYAEQALALWDELGDRGWQARVRVHLGIRAYHTGDWAAALHHYSGAREAFESAGDLWGASVCAGNTAEIYVDQGRLEEAIEPTRLALRAAKVAGARSFVALWTAQLGRIAIREGRHDEGLALLQEAHDIYDKDGEAAAALVVQAQVAAGLALGGRPAEALTTARSALEQLGKVPGASEAEALMQRARGYALIALGRAEEGVAACHASLVAARSRGGRRDIALGLDALIAHADASAEQRALWVAERDQLVVSLGIAQLSAATDPRPMLRLVPEQAASVEAATPVLAG